MVVLTWLKRLWPGVVEHEIRATAAQVRSHWEAACANAYQQGYWDGAKDQQAKTMRNFIKNQTENQSKN